ncbi:MAG: addiction module protein [Deltaproteobacteria bacterium]|nr:addiction module protein [Candidatus Tharpella sp.]
MDVNQLERDVLFLPEEVRAQLAHKLLLSLDVPSQKEIEEDWLIEASRRSKELDMGIIKPIPAEAVRRKAQALLR